MADVTTYQVRYRKIGTTTWTEYGEPTTNLNQALTGLQPNQTYQVQVLATNPQGAVASQIVNVSTSASAPAPPGAPAVSAITATSVVLNWNTSPSGSLPIAYQPLFRIHNVGGYNAFGSPLNGTSATLTGLTGSTSYDFEVVAANSAGSATSGVTTASTLSAGNAPSAPSGLALSAIQQTQVTLNWVASSGAAPITYQPQYRVHGALNWINVPSSPIAGTVQTFTGLTAGTSYDFEVVATNSIGSATSSILTSSTAAANVAPGVPGTPAASTITNSSMTLTWTASATGTAPITYQPQYRITGTSTFANFGVALSGLTVSLTGLTASTGYDFQVVATNSAGSATSGIGSATTAAALVAPAAPTGLAASSITQSGLSLSWVASATGTTPITYTPQFRINGSGSVFTNATATTTTSQNLTNLTPNTTYDLQVAASNSSGSATSSPITATTLIAATTWDPANTTTTEFNLTNGNLTLNSKATIQGGSISTTSRGSSMWYVEIKPTLTTGTQRIGFANATAVLTTQFGDTADSIGIDPSGNAFINGVQVGTGVSWIANDVISLALDEVNGKLFYQVNGGGWGTAPGAGESGTQSVGTAGSGPVITGPASAHLPLSQSFALTGVVVNDTVWPHAGTAAINVICINGTVSMTLGGAAVIGSGTNTINVNDTDANIQAMIKTISYTAPGSGIGDSVSVEVWDQLGQNTTLTIPIRLDSTNDPVNNVGGVSLLTLNAGPYFLAYSDSSNGDGITANFGATPMAFTPPTGFFTWDGTGAAAPQNMAAPTVSGVTSSAATLAWTAPPIGAPPFSYQPLYRVHGALTFVTFGAPTSLFTTTVTGLAAGSSYDFAVKVSNANGTSTSPVTSALTSSATVLPGQIGGAQSSGGNPNVTGPLIGSTLFSQPLYVTGIRLTDTSWPTTSNNTLAVSCTSGTVRMSVGGSNVSGSGTKTISYASTPGNVQAAAASLVYTAPASGTADSVVVKLTDQAGSAGSITIQISLVALSSGAPTSDFTLQLGTIGNTSIALSWTAPSSPASATPTVFDTEFDTFVTHRAWQSPDPWGYCATISQDGRGGPSFGEFGQQWWTNPLNPNTPINNLYIDSGGILQLGLGNTPSADASYINAQAGAAMPYVGCLLNNQNVAFRQFGYYEYKVAVPKIPGFCFQVDLEDYPATATWNLEIDMSIGTNGSGAQSLILQFQWAQPSFSSQIVYTNTSLDFTQSHVYALNWQSDFITLYIDGSQVYQTPTNTYGSGVFTNSSMFCYMLTAANYQQATVNPNAGSLPAYAQVDYFRIYATKPTTVAGTFNYAVQYRLSGTFPWTITSQVTVQSETISGLQQGTAYDFQVGASNTAGIGYSNIIGGTTSIPQTTLPGDTTGTTAGRIADLMELFGVNTFSSTSSTSNTWGTFPSDYSQASVINALNYLTGNSGLVCNVREYHYAGKEQWQATWCPAVFNATGALFTMAIGANGSDSDVASMMAMGASSSTSTGWMRWAEGNNEPNNNFGSGVVPAATTVTVQQDIFTRCQNTNSAQFPVAAVGPSLIFGLPNPETGGPLAGYLNSTQLSQVAAAMSFINVHFYPSANPDVNDNSGRGGEFDDVKVGLDNFWGARPQIITEWHPSLYATDGSKGNDAQDAYRAPIFGLNAYRLGYVAAFLYALYDWQDPTQSGYLKVGLWPNNFGQTPRPIANTLRAMYTLTGDPAPTTGGTGPAASGSFINADFSVSMNKTVVRELFGVSTATMLDFNFQICNTVSFQQAARALTVPLLRFNCASGASGGNVWQNIFGSNPANTPDWTVIAPLVNNLNKIVDLSTTKIIIGIGGDSGSNSDTLGWSTSQYASACSQVARHLATTNGSDGKPINPMYWEIMNEPNIGSSSYNGYFNAAADALHAVNPNYIVTGPAAANDTGLCQGLVSGSNATRLGLLNDHSYLYCPGADPVPTDLAVAQAILSGGGGTSADQMISSTNAVTGTAAYAANLPFFWGEYNIGCGPNDTNNREQTMIGALFAASCVMKLAAGANTTIWAGIWEFGPAGGWGLFSPSGGGGEYTAASYTPDPQALFLSNACQRLPGTMVQVARPGAGSLEAWATKNGASLGLIVVNPTTSPASGQVALSHWPLNSTGTATIHSWTQTSGNRVGSTATVTVNAGMTQSITFPAQSIVILYP